jgi:hypothetical protein
MSMLTTATLDDLINDARALAGGEGTIHRGVRWEMAGGRACPIGWEDCSQPVFYSPRLDAYDYGDAGGPGAAHCKANCPHHNEPAPEDGPVTVFSRQRVGISLQP